MQKIESNNILSYYINQIEEKIDILKSLHSNEHTLLAYRGESKIYDTSLCPSLFRFPEHIHKEIHFFELFHDYNLVHPNASNIEKAIEVQHYAAFTRMLDITFDACIALYFSCRNNIELDGQLFLFAFPEHYSPHSSYLDNFYNLLLEGKHPAYSRNFKVFSHCYTNDRIKAQKGGFIFFPGKEFHAISAHYYEKVLIKSEHKEILLNMLDALFNINKSNIYPEKGVIAEIVKEKFYKIQAIDANVTVEYEIVSCLNRLDYELSIERKRKSITQKDTYNTILFRYLRKEKSDLFDYIQKNTSYVSEQEQSYRNQLLRQVANKIKSLEIKYMEK